ncbi:DNA primase [Paracrocinitomix mangrovi]|uniref:DNA primase n=1 Tax=Paracrocinitomix mangrovi TaxID=2862509 RepID=UPI001C8EAA7C|nr:DNA primase [Paracrocinitomix mangrovi]UKN00988.1 DNA primase [Paracrocinitomix mangrovi]
MIPKQTIDEIFQTARVEEVIGDFVHLKKSGSNFKAKSPFVDEKTPSFMVSPAKQIWKCFSSGKGGNVVSFLMEHEHFSYVEALKWLAAKYNIVIKEEKERTPEEQAAYSLRENLSIINEFARDHFVYNLHNNEQGKAIGLSYFVERGFREDIIEKFQLGYCLDEFDAFTKAALAKNYKLEYLEKAGLTKTTNDKSFDFFKGRVMFPIHSVAGKVLGFGGRTLRADKKVAKYFNSPESELYNKSKILYGLYFAKNSIIKYDRCFLVEGYTDVISLHQSGVENVVASSGTALTEGQIKLIKRYSENITILYDGDAAGIKASFRGIDMILEQGMNVKVVLFPEGEDPDSFAKKSTADELINYIEENSKDFIVFKADVLLKDAGNDPIQKASLIKDIVHSISKIPDAIKRQVYTRETASMFGMDEQVLINELSKLRKDVVAKKFNAPEIHDIPEDFIPVEQSTESTTKNIADDRIYSHELDLMRILLNYGIFMIKTEHVELDENDEEIYTDVEVSVMELIIHEMERDEIVLTDPTLRKLYNEIKAGLELEELRGEKYFTQHEDPEIANMAVNILTNRYELSPNWTSKKVYTTTEIDNLEMAVKQVVYSYKTARIRKEKDDLQNLVNKLNSEDPEGNIDEILTLLAKQKKLDEVITLLTNNDSLGRVIH